MMHLDTLTEQSRTIPSDDRSEAAWGSVCSRTLEMQKSMTKSQKNHPRNAKETVPTAAFAMVAAILGSLPMSWS